MMPGRLACVLLLTLFVAACGPHVVTSDVTRFHALPPDLPGRTFTILPDQSQLGSLEFQTYADQVAARLEQLGLRPVADANKADLVVSMAYGIGPPRTIVTHTPSPVYGSFGWWGGPRRHWGWGWGVPFGPVYDTHVITKYTRWLDIDINGGEGLRQGRPARLFEGRAISDGGNAALPQVMPYLIAAMFDNFPGNSGQTVRVAVPVPE